MTTFTRFDDDGRYTSVVTGPIDSLKYERQDRIVMGEIDPRTHYHDLDTNVSVRMPPQPTPAHTFDYAAKQWVLDVEAAWMQVRTQRDQLLSQTDWVVMRATDQGEPIPAQWQAHRQALRDITDQPDPCSIEWPKAPEASGERA